MIKVSRVTILAEDKNHQTFARHYLMRVGYKQHQIFIGAVGARQLRARCA
jgi:hypothetical protein